MQNQVKRSQRLEHYNVKKLRVCSKLINFAKRMKILQLKPQDKEMQLSFPTEAYQAGFSREFFKLVKQNDLDAVELRLKSDPFLVYQKDHLSNTPLHWAAKRKLLKMTALLIDH